MRTTKTVEQAEHHDKTPEQVETERHERWMRLLRENEHQAQPPSLTPPGLNRPRR